MATSLRELLLAIRVKVDKDAVKQTDAAFDHAAKSAATFETRANSAASALKAVGAQLAKNLTLSERLAKVSAAILQPGALPNRPEAPSNRNARLAHEALGMPSHPAPPRPGEGLLNLAAPDVSKFMDPRSGATKALDAFRAKASSAMASAGAAVQRFNARFDGVTGAIFNARTAVAGFAVVVAGTAIGRFLNDVIEAGGALHDMAQRTRVSVETLQVWRAIATDAGVDAGSLEGVFRKLTKSMAAAARGSKQQAASFKELGVDVKNTDGSLRPIEDVLIDTGSALAQMDDDAKATAIATQLLGASGMGLVPAFNGGADAVRKLSQEMKENVALNAEEAARLDDVGDAIGRAEKKWVALKTRAVVALLPLLERASASFERASKWILRMAKETEILRALLASFAGLGLLRVVSMFGAWAVKVGGARAAMALLGQGLRTAAVAAFEFVAPLLIIEDFLTFLAGGKSLFGRAFEEIFGAGGAKEKRKELLSLFEELGAAARSLGEAFSSIGASSLIGGTLKLALDGILGVLNLIGMALTDDSKKLDELGNRFMVHAGSIAETVDKVRTSLGFAPQTQFTSEAPTAPSRPVSRTSQALAEKSGFFADKKPASFAEAFGFPQPRAAGPDGVVRMPAAPPVPMSAAGARQTTLTDNRRIDIHMGDKTAGGVARSAATAVSAELTKDRRQTMMALQ